MTRTFLYFQALANTIYSLSRLAEESVVWFSKEAAISPMYQGSGWQKFNSKKKNNFALIWPLLDSAQVAPWLLPLPGADAWESRSKPRWGPRVWSGRLQQPQPWQPGGYQLILSTLQSWYLSPDNPSWRARPWSRPTSPVSTSARGWGLCCQVSFSFSHFEIANISFFGQLNLFS